MATGKKQDIRLTDDQVFVLVELYHEYECLWNIGSECYHKKEHRQTALRAISAEMETRTNKVLSGEYRWKLLKRRLLVLSPGFQTFVNIYEA